ncbi:amidophosphoribosyltransferase [Spathaspora passalidarum NRRL Y-27907]|uniref:Amidophosphoribosyltransferase n=1 Tax=Spathaspora passalidarum (strain NRRL Y-27907 / 11-Y1) TaxID=619300 RepID=G3AG26_SPAPN|nr:amidophosphoribosyltransferase [Spathaspora passalidarum NRRL Y-27907]EGW35165.1 amidophosphoribosyltransferase [Spathaspora passalidarum NRRL Y-27907]
MCGILGVVVADQRKNVASELFEGAMFLQHRGQDAAGIVTSGPKGRFYQCKGNGMARDVFTQSRMNNLIGNMGICHLRYPTAGSSAGSEAQPFYVNSPYGITLSHNGNLVNSNELREYLDEVVHRHINTDSDSELLINIFAAELDKFNKSRVNNGDLFSALTGTMDMIRGAYACVAMLAGYGIIGFRDPNGIRPLLYGERTNKNGTTDYMLASESVVLKAHGFDKFRDIKPGEAVIITKDGAKPEFRQVMAPKIFAPDIFEYVYFARPDSVLDGVSVYRSRIDMGVKLAEKIQRSLSADEKIDVVIPVPDTARTSAFQCSVSLNVPYREGFVKNRYVGRTFIMPDQQERRSSVRRKLNAMDSEFQGRNVLLVDDSIVRGTTSKEIVAMAREAGAKKVFFASCAPPIRFNHIYGIDLADTKALVGFNRDEDEIASVIGADKVIYQDLEDLIDCCKRDEIQEFEVGVFNGKYVTGIEDNYIQELEKVRAQNQRMKEYRARGMSLDTNVDQEFVDVKPDVDISIHNSGDYNE